MLKKIMYFYNNLSNILWKTCVYKFEMILMKINYPKAFLMECH